MAKSIRDRFGQVFGKRSEQDAGKDKGPVYSAPAPVLTPPGIGAKGPQQQGYPVESRQQAERRVLREELQPRVRGEISGQGSMMNSDWEAMKLAEAKALKARREQATQQLTDQTEAYRKGLAERGRKLDAKQQREQSRQTSRDRDQERD